MNEPLFFGVFVASLLGSVHCASMCGPFVAVYSGLGSAPKSRAGVHAAYHLGRLLTYGLLGVLAGVVGSALDLAGSAAGIARVSGLVAGALMVLWGLSAMLETQGFRLLPFGAPDRLRRLLGGLLSRLEGRPPVLRALAVGLATTLLPCGWLYAFVVTAAGTGSVIGAASVMGAFWLGTVPLLLGAGLGISALASRFRRHGPLLSSALLVVVGLGTIVLRLHLPAFSLEGVRGGATTLPNADTAHCPLHQH